MGGHFVCDLNQISGCANANDGFLTIIHNFNGNTAHSFSAWGSCNTATFCCVFDDDASHVDKVIAAGTSGNDNIHFDYGHDVPDVLQDNDLSPEDTASPLLAFMYAGAGDDNLEGSHYTDTGGIYRDNLYGENGNDTIDGNHDGDWLSGGGGNDTMKGDNGNDTVVSGQGSDSVTGETGADLICDDAKAGGVCGAQYGDYFNGGDGDDTIWYAKNGCSTSQMDTRSTGGPTGSDRSGDSVNWMTSELPLNTSYDVTSEPAACADPN